MSTVEYTHSNPDVFQDRPIESLEENPERLEKQQYEQFLEVVKTVDFSRLQEILKARVPGFETTSKFPTFEDVEILTRTPMLGEYAYFDLERNKMVLYMKAYFKDGKLDEGMVLHGIIHESTHMVAKNRYQGNLNQQSGYMKISPEPYGTEAEIQKSYKDRGEARHHIYWLLNEAVTEKSARETLQAYCLGDENIISKSDLEQHFKALEVNINDVENFKAENHKHYNLPVALLDKIIDKISQEIGVPKETVWNGIKRGYFEEGSSVFEDEEVMEGFESIFSKEFLENLSKYGYNQVDQLMVPDKAARKVYKQTTGQDPLFKLVTSGLYLKAFSKQLKTKIAEKFSRDPLSY